jgi:hypothetical protein
MSAKSCAQIGGAEIGLASESYVFEIGGSKNEGKPERENEVSIMVATFRVAAGWFGPRGARYVPDRQTAGVNSFLEQPFVQGSNDGGQWIFFGSR